MTHRNLAAAFAQRFALHLRKESWVSLTLQAILGETPVNL